MPHPNKTLCIAFLLLLTCAAHAFSPMKAPLPPPPPLDLAAYPLDTDDWAAVLNPTGEIPAEGFTAYYFDVHEPTRVVARESAPIIAFNQRDGVVHGIPAANVGIYWVGNLHIPQAARYRFRNEHSMVYQLLDKHILSDRSNFDLDLDAGTHLLEVLFTNEYRFLPFTLEINPAGYEQFYADSDTIDDSALRTAIDAQRLPANTVAYLASIDKSARHNRRVTLHAPRDARSYILILSAKDTTIWNIEGRAPAFIIHTHRSHIDGLADVPRHLWRINTLWSPFSDEPDNCQCLYGYSPCDMPEDLDALAKRIHAVTGYPLAGISDGSTVDALKLPQMPVNATTLADNAGLRARIAHKNDICDAKARRDFDDIMQPPDLP